MKTPTANKFVRAGLMAVCLGLPVAFAAGDAGTDQKGFLEKMDQWQDRMSEKFRDTWKSLRGDSDGKSFSTASVDLREDRDRHTVRLDLPDRDLSQVTVKLDGNTLRIVAPAAGKSGRYEQSLALADVKPGTEPAIQRKQEDHMIVVTVAKQAAPAVAGKSPAPFPNVAPLPLSDWESDVFARMERMRREMDRTFEEAFREFRASPENHGFFDEPRFGSSFDLKEDGDAYVVRAYLPDRDMQNINVTIEDRTLKIEATEQETTRKQDPAGTLHSTRKAAFSQLIMLPGPVRSDQMKVDKKEGMVVVSLPKSK